MKKIAMGLLISAALMQAHAQGNAASAMALIGANGCTTCHTVEQKLIGPAFRSVGEKYQAQKDTNLPILVKKIQSGGAGNWGRIPMPAHPGINEADLHTIVAWILSGAPSP